MRVLYSYPLHLGRTGIGAIAGHHVEGLVRRGVDVHLSCGLLERPVAGCRRIVETWKVLGRPLFRGARARRFLPRAHDRRVAAALFRDRRRIDLVHCWPDRSLATLRMARRLGIPAVLERPNCHTGFAFDTVARECERLGLELPEGHPHRRDPVRLEREEREYALATRLLCPSEFVARTFRERGYERRRVARHRYGYDPSRFPLGDQESYDRARRGLRAVFVGRAEPRKGLHHALRAWCGSAASRNGRLRIHGRMVPGYREKLRSWLDHPSVEEAGFTDDVPAAMRAADVLLLPSVEEGSALVTYEARGSGLVLLVSDASGAVAEHGIDSLVHAAGDHDALRRHLDALATDDGLWRRLRQKSIERIGELTWDAAAARLAEIYEETVAA